MASSSILFFFIYLFQLEDNYNIVMAFAIHQYEPAIGIHVSTPSEAPSHLLLQSISPGCHRAPALGALHHTSNSQCLSILHMVTCMFQYYSLKSSHPLFPHWVQKSVLYICVSFVAPPRLHFRDLDSAACILESSLSNTNSMFVFLSHPPGPTWSALHPICICQNSLEK